MSKLSSKIVSRLSGYWKMEAANVLLVPLLGAFLVLRADDTISLFVIATMVATSALLVIGAVGWRMELARLQGDKPLAEKLMRWLAPSQRPALIITIIGVFAAMIEFWRDGSFTPSAIAALVYGILAVLEYVNYYVAQLQHFDHAADFKRLLTGKGFRRPHLAKAIAKWRG